jgi:hypothetical protein
MTHRSWGKPDASQQAIVAALRQVGVSVQSLSAVGDGCPDLLCSYRGYVTLLEVKRPKKTLTPDQVRWHAAWDSFCPLFVVETIDDALLVTREHRDSAGRYRG